jgi:hypothetical protein
MVTAPINANTFPTHSSLRYVEWCIRPEKRDDFYHVFVKLPALGNYQLAQLAGLGRQLYNNRTVKKIEIQYKNKTEDAVDLQTPGGGGVSGIYRKTEASVNELQERIL